MATHSMYDLLFNGWPATYADIATALTFERSMLDQVSQFLPSADALCAIIVGASGVGKTTAARQVIYRLHRAGAICWEHKGDHTLQVDDWLAVAHDLAASSKRGAIFIDDAAARNQAVCYPPVKGMIMSFIIPFFGLPPLQADPTPPLAFAYQV
jgi:hypothetical protein